MEKSRANREPLMGCEDVDNSSHFSLSKILFERKFFFRIKFSYLKYYFQQGMFSARGRYLLFADADGASKFSDFTKLENEMKNMKKDSSNRAVVCGSRAHLEEESIAQVMLVNSSGKYL